MNHLVVIVFGIAQGVKPFQYKFKQGLEILRGRTGDKYVRVARKTRRRRNRTDGKQSNVHWEEEITRYLFLIREGTFF